MFDGARTLRQAQLEITPFASGSYYHATNRTATGYLGGIRAGIGISKKFDLRVAYGYGDYNAAVSYHYLKSRQQVVTLEPKFSFLNGHLSFQVPVGLIFSKANRSSFWLQPGITGSLRIKEFMEFNLTTSIEIVTPGVYSHAGVSLMGGFDPDFDPILGGNFGLAFSSNLRRWSVRPEGFLYFPLGQYSHNMFYGWAVAFTYNIDLTKK